MKTFRLKRTAKKYQKLHGGRITGTTGAYQVKSNRTKRRKPTMKERFGKALGMNRGRRRRNIPGFKDSSGNFHPLTAPRGYRYDEEDREKGTTRFIATRRGGGKRKNPGITIRKVKRPKGWVKARAVKIERGRVLIKR